MEDTNSPDIKFVTVASFIWQKHQVRSQVKVSDGTNPVERVEEMIPSKVVGGQVIFDKLVKPDFNKDGAGAGGSATTRQ